MICGRSISKSNLEIVGAWLTYDPLDTPKRRVSRLAPAIGVRMEGPEVDS